MVSDSLPPGETNLELERKVLRAMCQLAPADHAWLGPDPVQRLAHYHFRDPVHQVIFDTLGELRKIIPISANPWHQAIREHLASRLTLKGFPEFDLEALFSGANIEEDDLQRCISGLTADSDAP